jgi:hypothetical protein
VRFHLVIRLALSSTRGSTFCRARASCDKRVRLAHASHPLQSQQPLSLWENRPGRYRRPEVNSTPAPAQVLPLFSLHLDSNQSRTFDQNGERPGEEPHSRRRSGLDLEGPVGFDGSDGQGGIHRGFRTGKWICNKAIYASGLMSSGRWTNGGDE